MTVTEMESQADRLAAARDFPAALALLGRVVAAQPEHITAWLKIAGLSAASGKFDDALRALDQVLLRRPLDFPALLMRANMLHASGRIDDAGETYGRALAQAPEHVPPQAQAALKLAAERYALWQTQQAERLRAAVRAVTPLTPALDRFVTNSVHLTPFDREGPTHYCFPGLGEQGYHDPARFPWLSDLAAATDVIQAEFEQVVAAEAAELVPYISYPEGTPVEQWAALNNNRDWTAIHLFRNGHLVEANARHCPQTMALLATLPQPQIAGAGPNAMFSLLAPGAHIPPHTGISNARLVCHLPLIVPPGCWFRVGEETRDWQRGKPWVFDDTVDHEALNPSTQLRVILIADVWHPQLDDGERAGIAAMIAAGGRLHGL